MAPFLDERGRRLFTASEARAAGRGGVTAVATATRVARSTIGRGLAELRRGRDDRHRQKFRVWAGMMGGKEPNHAETQRASYSGCHPGPAFGWGRSKDGLRSERPS